MKKNRTMRVAALLLALTLITSCFVGGTFAKYVTSVESVDNARIAKWNIGATVDLEDLFAASYTNVTAGSNETAIIAPGTSGSVDFTISSAQDQPPEVAYNFTVNATGEDGTNGRIKWSLKKGTEQLVDAKSFGDLTAELNKLSATNVTAGTAPAANGTYTISWEWPAGTTEDDHKADTAVGNAGGNVNLTLSITAEQVVGTAG